jgi:hypothetical protein
MLDRRACRETSAYTIRDTRLLASGFWLLASGFWPLASGLWLLASGFWLLTFLMSLQLHRYGTW